MRTRCPSCGATLSLDALIAHDAAREALAAAFKLSGQLGSALVRYLALFRPESRELTMDRVARLVGDLLPDLQAQRISRNGQVYDAPLEAWVWAIEQALGQPLFLGVETDAHQRARFRPRRRSCR